MPGTIETYEVVVFDKAMNGDLIEGDNRVIAESRDAALELVDKLSETHAGAIALYREGRPAVGESGPAMVIHQRGHVGEFI